MRIQMLMFAPTLKGVGAAVRHSLCLLTGAAALIGVAGCETSSHKSVRTYDYNDQGRPTERANEAEEQDSEYHMVSPGEMVVDPHGR